MNWFKLILPVYFIIFSYFLSSTPFDSHDISTQLEYIFKNYGLMLEGHSDTILSISLYKEFLITGSKDCTIRIWHQQTGQQVNILYEHRSPVLLLEVLDEVLISASSDGVLVFWDLNSLRKFKITKAHDGWVSCIKGWNQSIWTSGHDGYLVRHDLHGRLETRKFLDGPIQAFDVSEDGKYTAICDSKGNLTVWEGENLILSKQEGRTVNCLKITGKQIAVSYRDEGLVVIGLDNSVQKFETLKNARILKETKGPLLGVREAEVFILDLTKNQLEKTAKIDGSFFSAGYLEEKKLWFARDNYLSVFDIENNLVKNVTEVLEAVIKVKIDYDKGVVITNTEQGRTQIWSLTSQVRIPADSAESISKSHFF